MDVSIYQAAAAMNASTRWQEVIADNLSASQVPGFKKQDLSFSAVQAGYMAKSLGALSGSTQKTIMPVAAAATNFKPGELRATNNSTDFGIEGQGFFEVQLPDGRKAYTRDGEFRLSPQGQLVTKQGYTVLTDNGPLQFDMSSGQPITVAANGEASQGDMQKGKLRIAEIADTSSLATIGNGLYVISDPAVPPPKQMTAGVVRQGFLEGSNTSGTLEMSSLISAMRFYEANQRVVQMADERLGRLIGDVANPM
jgi:flagellar basal body rod protein FlgG